MLPIPPYARLNTLPKHSSFTPPQRKNPQGDKPIGDSKYPSQRPPYHRLQLRPVSHAPHLQQRGGLLDPSRRRHPKSFQETRRLNKMIPIRRPSGSNTVAVRIRVAHCWESGEETTNKGGVPSLGIARAN